MTMFISELITDGRLTVRRLRVSTTLLMALGLMLIGSGDAELRGADEPIVDAQKPAANRTPSAEQLRFFETRIRPLLIAQCTDCHGEDLQESELRLDTLAGMLRGGKAGPVIVPGKPESSLLLTAVGYQDNTLQMPPEEKLNARQIADLRKWIKLGAPHPDSGKVDAVKSSRIDVAAARKHWSFRAPEQPEIPLLETSAAIANPIDAFILQKLEAAGLTPTRQADKRTLIRRVTFDLIGLPPSPQEVANFLADDSPDAFAKVVDRLLASPHYGERWARHWLDIARYADSNGLDENVAFGHAWRYRDYVVQAFNDDKPYDRFLAEQLAGDLLPAESPAQRRENLIATGYLTLGPKVLAEVDARKMEMDIIDEQIDTVGRGLLGLTLGCARCHDHKFDPIAHSDYYALAGIFMSTRSMEKFGKIGRWNEVSIATPEQLEQKTRHDASVAEKEKSIAALVAAANTELQSRNGSKAPPKNAESQYPEETRAELKRLREELATLKKAAPRLPMAMAVNEGDVQDTSIHIRGSHLTLGEQVERRFPQAVTVSDSPHVPEGRSGRLALAQWMTRPDHPLTSRVMVNRIWRGHFGRGLVTTPDNFGRTGEAPTHPELLDWLALKFIEEDWSIKSMHRLILLSQTYQRGDGGDASAELVERGQAADPENRLYWRYTAQRLQAEALRDAMLAISGELDRTMGGSLLAVGNREYLFNHTSQDKSTYDTRRRSLYIPVIRNHLYDMFQLFDYSDASVLNGDREASTVPTQALFLMNSALVREQAGALADRLLAERSGDRQRIELAYQLALGRPPSENEIDRSLRFVGAFTALPVDDGDAAVKAEPNTVETAERAAWQTLCQTLFASNEFAYIR